MWRIFINALSLLSSDLTTKRGQSSVLGPAKGLQWVNTHYFKKSIYCVEIFDDKQSFFYLVAK